MKNAINFENEIRRLRTLQINLDSLISQECTLCGPFLANLAFKEYTVDDSWNIE